MNDENDEKKDIEVVEGMGNLEISPVYDNLTIGKPKMQDEKPKNIVIPQTKKITEDDDIEEKEEDSDGDADIDDADEDEDEFDQFDSDEDSDDID